jgi:DNA-binding YbaB/EbfC family protein
MPEFDLSELMRQAQQMREQMESMQRGLATKSVEASAGGGMVKVTMTGAQEVTKVTIHPSMMSEDIEMVQDLIVAAVNNAIAKSKELAQEQLGSMLPPGLFPGGIPTP